MKKVLAFILSGMILFATLGTAFAEEFIEVDYQTHFIRWDGTMILRHRACGLQVNGLSTIPIMTARL